jgi:hypothetical protein
VCIVSGGGDQPDHVTQTQTTNPPDYLIPSLQNAATEATAQYEAGPNTYYSGQTVTPQSAETQQALQMTAGRATAGSPVNQAATGYTADVLGGKYLNSNPYIDATFDKAAQGTRSQLDSQFAGSGRNIGASYAARADQLNNLATNIYGQNYANERTMQNATLGQANSIANQDYVDAQQLGQVGAANEEFQSRQIADEVSRYDYAKNAPGIALDQYIARLGGQSGGSSTSTTPYFSNKAGSALGGAAAGYGIGSQIGSGYGGYGAALGGLLGYYG